MKMKETTTRGQARKDDRPREGRLWEVIDKNQIEGCKGYWRASQLEYCGAGWTGANATCAEGVRAVRRPASNCAIRAEQSLVRGTRSSRHGRHLDRSSLRAKDPSLIGTALYHAMAARAAQKKSRSHPAWTEARSQSRTQGGVGPGS